MSENLSDHTVRDLIMQMKRQGDDIAEMRDALKEMAKNMSRLTLVEERQAQVNEAMGRAFKKIDDHDDRIKTMEIQQPLAKQSQSWVQQAVWACVAFVGVVVAKKIGVI